MPVDLSGTVGNPRIHWAAAALCRCAGQMDGMQRVS